MAKVERKKLNISDEVNKFFFSPKVFIILLGIVFFAILNYVFFSLGYEWAATDNPWGFGTDGIITGTDPDAWFGYLNITISTIGGVTTIFALILTVRLDKSFIIPMIIGETLVLADSIMIGAVFTGLSYFFMICASIYNYIKWGNGGKDDMSRVTNITWILSSLFFVAYLLFGLTFVQMSGFNGGLIGSFSDVWGNWYDVIGSGIVVVAYVLMYKKFKYTFFAFLATDIIYMIFFFQLGLWSTAASYIVYLFTDTTSMLTWWYKDERLSEGKELKVEN